MASVVVETIREIHPHAPETIELDTKLGPSGLELESIQVLELVLVLEERLGARFRNEDLDGDALSSVAGLVAYVDAHLG